MSATTDQLQRTRLLPAYVEIMLAVSDIENGHSACRDSLSAHGDNLAALLPQ